MTFSIENRTEIKRIVQSTIIACYVELDLLGEDGNSIQAYIDAQVIEIDGNPSFYTIEADNGGICGYFTLVSDNGVVTVRKRLFKPQFSTYFAEFNTMINNFIISGNWRFDVLQITIDNSPIIPPVVIVPPTPPLDGQRIEEFGARGVYDLVYNQLDLTPLPDENATLVTYTGDDNLFSLYDTDIEFVSFRTNKNPVEVPEAGIINGNYFPNIISSRYSKIIEIIDGKNLKVDFVYNGGNQESPQESLNSSGYFFFDNRDVISGCIESESRTEKIYLRAGVTYVSKGGWNSYVQSDLQLLSDSDVENAAIKISMEDAFFLTTQGSIYQEFLDISFVSTFSSPYFFKLKDGISCDVICENIDFLPSHYNVPVSQDARAFLDFGIFWQDSMVLSRAGENRITNSNGFKERDEVPESIPDGATFVLPKFADSFDGGTLDGDPDSQMTDIAEYQQFILEDTKWQGAFIHSIKANRRNGNIFKTVGAETSEVYSTDIVSQGTWEGVEVLFDFDDDGLARKVTAPMFSWFYLANMYFSGGLATHSPIYDDPARTFSFRVQNESSDEFRIFMGNTGCFLAEFPTEAAANPIRRSGELRLYEQIPVGEGSAFPQTEFEIDGVLNTKISDTVFRIEQLGLQALTTVFTTQTESVSNTYECLVGDIITFDGDDYNIIKRTRRYVGTRALWDIELDAPILDANPSFTVKTSRTEFLLGQQIEADIVVDEVTGYFCYSSRTINFDMEGLISGYIRATDNLVNPDDSLGPSADSPLYLLSRYRNMKAISITNGQGNEMVTGAGLYYRNLISGSNISVNINGATTYWARVAATHDPVLIMNHPTLIPAQDAGGATAGEPRLYNPTTDGNGFISRDGVSIYIDGVDIDLSNVQLLRNGGSEGILGLYGNGTITLDNLETELVAATNYTAVVVRTASGMPATTLELTIEGNGGSSGINAASFTTSQVVRVVFTDWVLRNMWPGYLGNGFVLTTIQSTPGYCDTNNYLVNGSCP